jgi:glycosyltransferase involved in cell wall biosynthesis
MPRVSVLMPVYNGDKYLRETIDSVLNQTYKDFEFIVIDDGSTDNSLKIIESFDDERIKLIKQNHGKIVKALNGGLEIAKGEYIIRVDADDVSLPERFSTLVDYLDKNPETTICGSWANVIDENGKYLREMTYPPVENSDIKKFILSHCPFIHPSVIFRKKDIEEIGGYRKYELEDYELWTRILKKFKGHNIPEKLINYRVHSKSMTENDKLKRKLAGIWVRVLALVRY